MLVCEPTGTSYTNALKDILINVNPAVACQILTADIMNIPPFWNVNYF